MKTFFLLLAGFFCAFAQVDSNSVTVTVSRSVNLVPDETVFSVSVTSAYGASLDDILAALKGTGVTAAGFVSVSDGYNYLNQPPTLVWTFSLSAPLSKLKDTVAALTRAQQSQPAKGGLAISFYVSSTRVSARGQQTQGCVAADLVSDARARAQTTAAATGRILGRLLALAATTTDQAPACSLTAKFSLVGF